MLLYIRISRHERRNPDSNVHFFPSHFMSTLKNENYGIEGVASWTAKNNINIFNKKLLFVPINDDLHWSLIVVVNPGMIANFSDPNVSTSEEYSW